MALKLSNIFPKLIKDIQSIEKQVINKGWKEAAKLLQEEILDSISRGVSPVQGAKRFERYSKSYTLRILANKIPGKKVKPVNLKASGEMLDSIDAKKSKGGFFIWFKKMVNGKNLAEIHSFEGASKKKVIRQILPAEEEEYKKSITKTAREYLIEVTNDVLAKILRRY
jgi:hypothetical protein